MWLWALAKPKFKFPSVRIHFNYEWFNFKQKGPCKCAWATMKLEKLCQFNQNQDQANIFINITHTHTQNWQLENRTEFWNGLQFLNKKEEEKLWILKKLQLLMNKRWRRKIYFVFKDPQASNLFRSVSSRNDFCLSKKGKKGSWISQSNIHSLRGFELNFDLDSALFFLLGQASLNKINLVFLLLGETRTGTGKSFTLITHTNNEISGVHISRSTHKTLGLNRRVLKSDFWYWKHD